MTATKVGRDAASRARAVIKAQRWATRKEWGRSNWPSTMAAGFAVLGGALIGGLLSLTVGSGGLLGPALESDGPVVATAPAPKAVESAADPAVTQRGQVLVPAAGPEARHDRLHVPLSELEPWRGAVVFEEPYDPEPRAAPVSEAVLELAIQEAALAPLAAPLPTGQVALWRQNAVAAANTDGRPMIAIVIDDLGLNRINARRTIALRPPLTLAFMSYAPGVAALASSAKTLGHELLVHVPMEPRDPSFDAGDNVLTAGLEPAEVTRRLDWALSRFEGYVGINNHMGSKFTESPRGMAQVMAVLRSRGLLFLDSLTSGSSVGVPLAERMGVAHAGRDIFIDNEPENLDSIRRQLRYLEQVARREGAAVGIGHPHDGTIEVLADWLLTAERRGFALVPLSAIVRERMDTVRTTSRAG